MFAAVLAVAGLAPGAPVIHLTRHESSRAGPLVSNGTKETAIVRLQRVDSPESATMYLAKGGNATVRYIPPRTYEMRAAYRAVIASDCVTVTKANPAHEFEEPCEFEISRTGTVTAEGVITELPWIAGEVTLFTVEDGAARTEEISLAEFNRQ